MRVMVPAKPIGFNPRAHTGRDAKSWIDKEIEVVSIHAPTRVATHGVSVEQLINGVSIHAPTRGATLLIPGFNSFPLLFQSTRPHGARRNIRWLINTRRSFNPRAHTGRDAAYLKEQQETRVSIHAPTRGATRVVEMPIKGQLGFNPRAHTGRDHAERSPSTIASSFNPRAHTGRDGPIGSIENDTRLFQSTRPHGARQQPIVLLIILTEFQSTRPHGARLTFCGTERIDPSFQSTRPHGARPVPNRHVVQN